MLLAIDVGNSKIAFGIFEADRLKVSLSMSTAMHRMEDEYASLLFNLLPHHEVAMSDIREAIMCSVVPPLVHVFQDLCQRYLETPLLVVGPGIRTGVRIGLDNPREVGPDRIGLPNALDPLIGAHFDEHQVATPVVHGKCHDVRNLHPIRSPACQQSKKRRPHRGS